MLPYNYICIEGNIGAGKTTLCQLLAEDLDGRLMLEQFADNPFLPFFYKDPERHAFSVELFFMAERYKQMTTHLMNQNLFQATIIADYCFVKTLIFAKNNLLDVEFRLFQNLFHILNQNSPDPDLLVYMHKSADSLLRHIAARGRSYEQNIKASYLNSIQESYFEYFKSVTSFPVLLINADELDFVAQPGHYQDLKSLISQEYQPGLHRISFVR